MSAALSREDVLRIAELARLELTTAEVELFTRQLADILHYVEQIQALDTTGVAPTSHVMHRPLERDDAPLASLPRTDTLANAPDAATEAGLFKVPRVIG
jgi:aspartyl-tRNA(Asn)/glutamyl-tRNA(Gln) amidotransferase subunit C